MPILVGKTQRKESRNAMIELKELILKLVGVETYKTENDRLAEQNNTLAKLLEEQKAINQALADDFVKLDEELKGLLSEPEQYIMKELEKRTTLIEKEYGERMEHKWYGIGRQDAYAEMGIRNIEAHERGNVLALTPDGDIIELICGLEDVSEDVPEDIASLEFGNEHVEGKCEIEIGDLA